MKNEIIDNPKTINNNTPQTPQYGELALHTALNGYDPEISSVAMDIFRANVEGVVSDQSSSLLPATIIHIANEFYDEPSKAMKVADLVAQVLTTEIALDGKLDDEAEVLGIVADMLSDRELDTVNIRELMAALGINPEMGGLHSILELRDRIDELTPEDREILQSHTNGENEDTEDDYLDDGLNDMDPYEEDAEEITGDIEIGDEIKDILAAIESVLFDAAKGNEDLQKIGITGLDFVGAMNFFNIELDPNDTDSPEPYEQLLRKISTADDETLLELMRATDADVRVITKETATRKLLVAMETASYVPEMAQDSALEDMNAVYNVTDASGEEWDI